MSIFTGCCTAIVTPFDEKGVNYKAYEKHIEYQLEGGISAILAAGSTGEPATMTEDEKKKLLEITIRKVDGRVPVIFGSGSYSTDHTIHSSKIAKDMGADAVLIVTPYYNKPTQDGLIRHFLTVADTVDIPIITYNVPSRTGINLLPETLCEIAKHKNVVAHKEASGSIRQVMDMVSCCGSDIDIMSGDDGTIFPLLACGGKGWISVVSNVLPAECEKLVKAYKSGDIDKSRNIQFEMDKLIKQLGARTNPIPVKCALNLMGFDSGFVRMPLTDMDGEDKDNLQSIMKEMNLLNIIK